MQRKLYIESNYHHQRWWLVYIAPGRYPGFRALKWTKAGSTILSLWQIHSYWNIGDTDQGGHNQIVLKSIQFLPFDRFRHFNVTRSDGLIVYGGLTTDQWDIELWEPEGIATSAILGFLVILILFKVATNNYSNGRTFLLYHYQR